MSMIRTEDPRPIKLMKSALGKLNVSTQTDASLPENIQLAEKGHNLKRMHMDHINFVLIPLGKLIAADS